MGQWVSSITSAPLFDSTSACLAKKHLTEAYWLKAKDLQTKSGCTLQSMLRSGVENRDSEIGIYAGDADCYEIFVGLLGPLLADFHGLEGEPFHVTTPTDSAIGDWNLNGREILSSRIRVARNLQGYPFTPQITAPQRAEVEAAVAPVLTSLPGPWAGTYFSYAKMDSDQRGALLKQKLFFDRGDRFQAAAGMARDWPAGRGAFVSHDQRFSVWVNEEDHLRISSTRPGGDIVGAYTHLTKGLRLIDEKLPFEYSERLGYLASCPSNVGTGLRASLHLRLPQLERDTKQLQDLVAEHDLALRGTIGEHSNVDDSVFDVSNRRRLGVSAAECLRILSSGASALLRAERKLAG